MNGSLIDTLVRVGFSEHEARAYLTLLREGPVTGYGLAGLSGIPRSAVHRVIDQLTIRGAVVALATDDSTKYTPVPVAEFLDRLHREYSDLIASLKAELDLFISSPNLNWVWNIQGKASTVARARGMIGQARSRIYLAVLPATFPALGQALESAIGRGVQVVVYSTQHVDLPGGRVVVTPISEENPQQVGALELILVCDGQEALIGEWLATAQARASWTQSPALVSILRHHLLHGGRQRFLISTEERRPINEPGVHTCAHHL